MEKPEDLGNYRTGTDLLHLLDFLNMDAEQQAKLKAAEINYALGVFLLFFGVLVLIAIFFTPTPIGKKTNLVAGLVLCGIGGGMALLAQR
ncbi:MAG: hypothetical protein KDD15_08690, partial [Lewinella sp.]|nr:hypothetical protein [Lewinella sp.]